MPQESICQDKPHEDERGTGQQFDKNASGCDDKPAGFFREHVGIGGFDMEERQACDQSQADFVGLTTETPDSKGVAGLVNEFQ